MNQTKLKISSIFHTLDGEVTKGGPLHWTTFVRTGGCNLRCWKSSGYCDAPHTLDINGPYEEMFIHQIFSKIVDNLPCKRVTITGGEPLLQADGVFELAMFLDKQGYTVTLETSGSKIIDREKMLPFASIIADVKPPSTEMAPCNQDELFIRLRSQDFIKAVIENRGDYDWVMDYLTCIFKINRQNLGLNNYQSPSIAFGRRFESDLKLAELVEWLRIDKAYGVMLNIQLHKLIWPESVSPRVTQLKGIDHSSYIKSEV